MLYDLLETTNLLDGIQRTGPKYDAQQKHVNILPLPSVCSCSPTSASVLFGMFSTPKPNFTLGGNMKVVTWDVMFFFSQAASHALSIVNGGITTIIFSHHSSSQGNLNLSFSGSLCARSGAKWTWQQKVWHILDLKRQAQELQEMMPEWKPLGRRVLLSVASRVWSCCCQRIDFIHYHCDGFFIFKNGRFFLL